MEIKYFALTLFYFYIYHSIIPQLNYTCHIILTRFFHEQQQNIIVRPDLINKKHIDWLKNPILQIIYLHTLSLMSQIKTQPNRQILWQNSYTTTKFVWELCFLIFTICLWSKLIHYTISYYNQNPICVVAGFIFAQFLVDFVSGILHWACDTWGEFSTPIVGPTLIRGFRMHHVDPQDITKHGFVETNASSSYPMPIFIGIGLMMTPDNSIKQIYQWTIIFAVVLGILTNQIHKWAHMVHSKPHPVIQFLQNSRLILSHQEHHRHHQNQFDKSYCIINGWMNPFLEKIDFWRKTERLITRLTGAQPRSDDVYWRPKHKCK